ncbi:hypothetical protein N9L92_04840 [Saprospiraceae bacterium]|nr:hypothetical protein [Saprospiraceae bacterium]
MSRLDLNYSSDQESVQFSLFMFIDDFEATIKEKEGGLNLKLFTEKESTVSDSLIYNYIQSHVIVDIDDESKKMIYIGREIDEKDLQGMWIYLEIENQKEFESLNITNSILTESFSDQRNIIDVMIDNKRKAYHILDLKNDNKKIKV